DVKVENKQINETLDQLFEGKEIRYFLFDHQIVLSNQHDDPGISGQQIKREQQQFSVSGTVTDESGQPLPGVTVVLKGSTHGTVTNADGNYSISDISEGATLVFTFIGMKAVETEIYSSVINVTMASSM